jgi:hypothetical protein
MVLATNTYALNIYVPGIGNFIAILRVQGKRKSAKNK